MGIDCRQDYVGLRISNVGKMGLGMGIIYEGVERRFGKLSLQNQ